MKTFNAFLRILLVLLMLMPILGVLNVFPQPTADMYSNAQAFAFISLLGASGYVMWMMAVVFAIGIVLTVTNRMAAVALLILPVTLNIIGFHAFFDSGLLSGGAVMADVFFLINIYFLWISKGKYKVLLEKSM